MSLDYARQFIDRVRSDDGFAKRLSEAETVEPDLIDL